MPKRSLLFDTHCHIDLFPDPKGLIDEIERAGVYTIAVTNTPSVFSHMASFAEGSKYVRAALGLHPELAFQRKGELSLMWDLMGETRYIGEVGLDYTTTNPHDREAQRRIFEQVIARCDESGDKIITIHSRRAAEDVVEIIGTSFRGIAILHWYSGSIRILKKAVSNGCYFSINPAMIRSKRFEQLLAAIPQDRILTETDGPFVKLGKNPAKPWDTEEVINKLAVLWQLPTEAVLSMIFNNFKSVLG